VGTYLESRGLVEKTVYGRKSELSLLQTGGRGREKFIPGGSAPEAERSFHNDDLAKKDVGSSV